MVSFPSAAVETIWVVDHDSATRSAVARVVMAAGFAVQQFASAEEFLDCYDPTLPGCLVLDIRLAKMSGLELQQTLSQRGLSPPIVFITAHGEVPEIAQAIRGGAIDVLPKPLDAETLLARIRDALHCDATNRIQQVQVEKIRECVSCLTDREREVMQHLADGLSVKEIAQRLDISPKTVDNHRAKVLEKMQVDNPTQLARKLALLKTPQPSGGEPRTLP